MPQYCHRSGCEDVDYGDAEFLCPTHNVDLLPDPPPGRAGPRGSGRAWTSDVCWSCGAPSRNPDNTECLECLEPLTPPRLVLTWERGTVRVDPGDSVQLGREGPHARLFDSYGNVSRRHATVGVDADGTPWIRPLEPTNGVFHPADGPELDRGSRHDLHDGETLRFALDVRATIAVYALPGT
jgi:hypothetical protein